MIKNLFTGRKKFLTISIAVLIGLFFLPITILLLISWLIYTKVPNKKIKVVSLSVISIFVLFFSSAYAIAIFSPSTAKTDLNSNSQIAGVTAASSPIEIPPPTITIEPSATQTPLNLEYVKVERVIDGDTISIEGGKVVRYIGIDTPEIVDPRKPVQCYAKEATARNKELVEGQIVGLEKDISETDKYNRLLRYVYKDDILINELLVKDGYAHSSSYPPDIKYQDKFRIAQQEAQQNKLGLWSEICTVTPTLPPPTPTPTIKPTTGSVQGKQAPTQLPTQPSQQQSQGSGGYTCNCSKTCPNLSCAEAQYQLNVCGCGARDADDDGIACDAQCQ